ncbi:hypothetical protein Celaphus_00016738 [Cervus elaphus hippelaphus]|uniref:Uncharacterized protein n=1 Tax=Cervus elaphus hippelaphus TaxID=46360 RepID=A0A212C4B9_CEREH|nr:hypothetical protein Celaphus_00016738 [Cervus elaphus hippelaphus]
MYSVLPEDRSQHLGEELQGYWDQELLRAKKDAQEPSLMKAVINCYWKSYVVWGIFTFLEKGYSLNQFSDVEDNRTKALEGTEADMEIPSAVNGNLSWYLVNSPVKRKQLTMAAIWMLSGGDSCGSSEANAEGVG